MPLVGAVVAPAAPILVPEVAADAAPELHPLREACRTAIDALRQARPDRLVLLGAAPASGTYPQGSRGSFRPFGVDTAVRLGDAPTRTPQGADELPRSLAVGAWLLAHLGWQHTPVTGVAVTPDTAPAACRDHGRALAAESDDRLALLVLGDGSACRSLKAPGYLDPRAEAYDESAAAALGSADTEALSALDPELSAELQAEGRAPWQVLAGAATAGDGASTPFTGRLLHNEAPYGVGYFVAAWTRA